MTVLKQYTARFPDIPGFFMPEAMVTWEFFLSQQPGISASGHALEIGVYKGKSAVLAAMYLRPEEVCFLNDINAIPECESYMRELGKTNYVFVQSRSIQLVRHEEFRRLAGAFRWIHIDGDHTGYSVAQDLSLAATLVDDVGIICVDDFFSFRYPQLTAAVYGFLLARPREFKLVFCGANKAYICRGNAYATYDCLIREHYLAVAYDHGFHMQLNRTSYAHDLGCFSISWKESERDLVGLDWDLDKIPF